MPSKRLQQLLANIRNLLRPSQRTDKTVGNLGEKAAANYLKSQGYQLLGRNIVSRIGEIDILAFDPAGKTLVVVEVKASRKDNHYHRPEFVVGRKKQTQLVKLAAQIARKRGLDTYPVRFDVVGVIVPADGDPVVRHHPGAFQAMI